MTSTGQPTNPSDDAPANQPPADASAPSNESSSGGQPAPAPPAPDSTPAEQPPAASEATPAEPLAPPAPPEPPAVDVGGTATAVAPTRARAEPRGNWWWGTGRRKAAVARVRIRPGSGEFLVNGREMTTFFTEPRDHNDLNGILERTKTRGTIDVHVKVHGGGYTGQAGAIILGLGRALNRFDPTLEPILREHNDLSRDPRRVERKKYGQPGARKRFQFSKR